MACKSCGLEGYDGYCPVCRGDEEAYMRELYPYFGEFYEGQARSYGIEDDTDKMD